MDVLADLLQRARARGATFAHTTVHGDWRVGFPAGSGLAVHAMADGEAWLRTPASEIRLLAGDVALVAGVLAHEMGAGRARAVPLDEFSRDAAVAGSLRRFLIDGQGPPAVFFCGAYRFEGDLCDQLLASLPDVVHVSPDPAGPLRAVMDLLVTEMQRDIAGQQTILDRLLDVVLVHVLREHFARAGDAAPPWYRALDDAEVGGALRLLHADPSRQWSVAGLAAHVGLSRAAFARRFATLVGTPPLQYLTDWRMALAREELRDTTAPLSVIAHNAGYASEFAFATAFKRAHGLAPGRWRTAKRTPTRTAEQASRSSAP